MNIKDLITKGQLDQAIVALQGVSEISNEIALLSLRYNSLKMEQVRGTISSSEYNRRRNQITHSLLEYSSQVPVVSTMITTKSSIVGDSDWVSSVIDRLKVLQKKVRFGFSSKLKEDVRVLLDDLLQYEANTRRDELYDPNEAQLNSLKNRFTTFVETYETTLRTKNKVKITQIKTILNELENEFSRELLERLVSALISVDTKYAYLDDALTRTQDFGLEDFAGQVAEIVDAL